ncbi:MAG: chemotaxis protein CheA, partial [Phycisphaerae bacterium]|nr:chemotaxis protein CheA [Phycisphaerae bacterium]
MTTVDTLENLSAEILALDPGDKETIVKIGTSLEQVLEEIPSDSEESQKILMLAVSVLQAIYEEEISDASVATGALAEAFASTAQFLADEENAGEAESLQQASDAMEAVLASSGENADADDVPDVEEEADDAQSDETDDAEDEDNAGASDPSDNQADETAPTLPEDTDQEIMSEFIVECLDHISAGEASMLDLESNPDDNELVNTIFRAFHTIKGTSGFLGLDHIQKLAHLAENLLDRAREGEIQITGGYADLALKSGDTLRAMIDALEGVEPGDKLTIPENYADLMEQLSDPEGHGIGSGGGDDEMRLGEILVGKGLAEREEIEEATKDQGDRKIGEVLVEKKIVNAGDVAKALRTQKQLQGKPATSASIRVGTEKLDNLINMVGELVIAQSMVAQDPDVDGSAMPRLTRNIAHAGKIIRELQDLTMSLRMVPLKSLFQKMTRLVRDLARKAGKDVQFVTEGEETEIDRNMVEMLNDPLVHMIRNSVDHGIELADKRRESGKNPTGTVGLRAYHSAGNVVIELTDDGKGLDRDRILAKAHERNLIESGKELTESEIFGLIFQAGFSTAEKITDVSGRGVGMDVVRKGIESLHGRVDVASKSGEGSTFTMKLPLTMAITDAMLLSVGSEHYLLPTVSIEQSFRPADGSISTVAGEGEMVML